MMESYPSLKAAHAGSLFRQEQSTPVGAGTHVNDEGTQVELLRCDDVMVTGLLRQLENGAPCSQAQAGHVRLAVETRWTGEGPGTMASQDTCDLGEGALLPRRQTGRRANGYLIFFCSVRSPSLTSMADRRRRVELADFDWLFFIPSNQRTSSLTAWTWRELHISFARMYCGRHRPLSVSGGAFPKGKSLY